MIQAWVGIPVSNFFPILFSQFFRKLGWEHCFSVPFPIQKVLNWFFIPTPNPNSWEFNFSFIFQIPTLTKLNWDFFWGNKVVSQKCNKGFYCQFWKSGNQDLVEKLCKLQQNWNRGNTEQITYLTKVHSLSSFWQMLHDITMLFTY